MHQEHTPAGHHVSQDVPFPKWVPREIVEEAQWLDEQEARSALGPWVGSFDKALKPTSRKTLAV